MNNNDTKRFYYFNDVCDAINITDLMNIITFGGSGHVNEQFHKLM